MTKQATGSGAANGDPIIAARTLSAPPSGDSGDRDFRLWLADALCGADSLRVRQVVGSLRDSEDARIWKAVFHVWFRVDADEAWSFADNPGNTNWNNVLRLAAVEEWAAVDPASARKVIDANSETQAKAYITGAKESDIRAAFGVLGEVIADLEMAVPDERIDIEAFGIKDGDFVWFAEKYPELAMAMAERLDPSEHLGPVLHGWLRNNPSAARAWLEGRADRDRIIEDAFYQMSWGEGSYDTRSIDFYRELMPDGNRKSELTNEALESLARKDPVKALSELERLFPDPSDRAESIGKITDLVADDDPDLAWEILERAEEIPSEIRRLQVPNAETVDAAPGDMNAYPGQYAWGLSSMSGFVSPVAVKEALLSRLIEVDKERALQRMDRLPPEDFLATIDGAMDRWADHEPEEALEWLARKLGDEVDLDDVAESSFWDGIDAKTLVELSQRLPAGKVRTALQMNAAADLALESPEEAIAYARDQKANGAVYNEIYNVWSYENPLEALDHIKSDPDATPDAWEEVVEACLKQSPDRAAYTVQSLEDGAAKDAAASAIAEHAADRGDPFSAAAWAMTMQGEEGRKRAIHHAIGKIGMDLRFSGDAESVAALRDLISSDSRSTPDQKALWLDQIKNLAPESP